MKEQTKKIIAREWLRFSVIIICWYLIGNLLNLIVYKDWIFPKEVFIENGSFSWYGFVGFFAPYFIYLFVKSIIWAIKTLKV